MDEPDKLPLVQRTLRLLVGELDGRDHVAIVAYAGAAGLVLPSTSGADKRVLQGAIDRLRSGGSTNGGAGIQLAYAVARQGYVDGGVNRVILATDGDFNVGVSSPDALERLIVDKARGGVFLSVLGFGTGNYKDSTMEMLADKGNGTCAYIDGLLEARRVMVEQLTASLVTVAKDAKVQVEFNPARVRSYRLIGYENRALRAQDFADDAKDGGEVGAGHTVTALYEVVPAGGAPGVAEGRRYGPAPPPRVEGSLAGELLNLKVRYKEPEGRRSRLLEWPVADEPRALDRTSDDFRFAAAVAEMAMLLRDSPHRGQATVDQVDALARGGLGLDPGGYRSEFLSLVDRARPLIAGER
jgi:Ca-activated chloride channel family protein